MNQPRNYLIPIVLVTTLFFLWAFLHNLNPILIPHLKKACRLSDAQSALIDTSVYLAYFGAAIPAGYYMHRFGYKQGIIAGLVLYAAGALLFLPAASARSYPFFLTALFIIAIGATFLETVANPYMLKLGTEATAARRLNFAQAFNGLGAFLAPMIGGRFILSGTEYTESQIDGLAASGQLNAYLQAEADTVKMPALVMAAGVFVLLIIFLFARLPAFRGEAIEQEAGRMSWKVLRIPRLRQAVIAQFFYVGAQVGVGSFFIRFAAQQMQLREQVAALWWGSIAMVGFMLGRFAGTWLMNYVRPQRLLALYAGINAALLLFVVFGSGPVAVYALLAVPFFMSIMYPTIFALGVEGLGERVKSGAAFLIMAIVGGGIFPLIMGVISDRNDGDIQPGYLVPLVCFLVVLLFALRHKEHRQPEVPINLKQPHG